MSPSNVDARFGRGPGKRAALASKLSQAIKALEGVEMLADALGLEFLERDAIAWSSALVKHAGTLRDDRRARKELL